MGGNVWRRLPKNFKLSDYLSDEQKDKIIQAIKRKIPIIISGKQAKTGKTYLKDYLTNFGITVYELWECEVIELNSTIILYPEKEKERKNIMTKFVKN